MLLADTDKMLLDGIGRHGGQQRYAVFLALGIPYSDLESLEVEIFDP